MGKLRLKLKCQDREKLVNLVKECKDETTAETEALRLLKHLESEYDIHDFPLWHYIPKYDDKGNVDIFPPFYDDENVPYIFVSMCTIFACAKASKKFTDDIWNMVNEYCWHEIKRIERDTKGHEHKLSIRTNIFFFLDILSNVAIRKGDNHSLVMVYNKLIELLDGFSPLPIWTKDTLKEFKSFSTPFENTINEMFAVLKEQDLVVIRHPKVIKSYVEAINYAIDDEPCLILGETGTGKELIAKAIHIFSKRKDNNFKGVNCAGFTGSLFQSEIQGVLKGTATGVTITRLGAFLSACQKQDSKNTLGYGVIKNGKIDKISFRTHKGYIDNPSEQDLKEVKGTILLDEINSLLPEHQAALLRIIQEKEVLVVGEDKPRKYIAKIVCASNTDLFNEVQQGNFRKDLYYRIAVGKIELPPLRKLMDVFPDIIRSRVDILSNKYGYHRVTLRDATINKLKRHSWPGNYRELDSVLYQALKRIQLDGGDVLNASHINYDNYNPPPTERTVMDFSGYSLDDLNKTYLTDLYRKTGGNQTQAAKMAGITRIRMRDYWIKHGIHEPRPYGKKKP